MTTTQDPFAASKPATADPFGQASGAAPEGDPFGSAPRPESNFLNGNDIKPNGIKGVPGALVLIRVDTAQVIAEADPYKEGATREKLIADVAVLDGEHAGRTQEKMWIFWGAITGSVKRAKKENLRAILGRVGEVPSSIEKKRPGGAQTVADLPAAYAAFRAGDRQEKPNVAVILEDHTPEEATVAREFLAGNKSFMG